MDAQVVCRQGRISEYGRQVGKYFFFFVLPPRNAEALLKPSSAVLWISVKDLRVRASGEEMFPLLRLLHKALVGSLKGEVLCVRKIVDTFAKMLPLAEVASALLCEFRKTALGLGLSRETVVVRSSREL